MMMSFGNNTSQKSTPFQIQKNNLFIGPKRPIKEIKRLTPDERQDIELQISEYQAIENRQHLTVIAITTILVTLLTILIF